MYLYQLNRTLRAEANEITDAGGGSPNPLDISGGLDPYAESGDDDNSDDSRADYNRYHGLSKGGKDKESTLLKFVEEEESKEESLIGKKEDEQKESDDKKDTDKKEDDKKEDKPDADLLDLDETKLKGHQGKPMSQQAGETIKAFKNRLTERNTEIESLKKTQLTEDQKTKLADYDTKMQKLADLEKQADEENFEKSEGFKQAFIVSIDEATKKIETFFTGLDKTKDAQQLKVIKEIFNDAREIMRSGDHNKFIDLTDELLDNHITGGSTKKALFATAMQTWFEKEQEFNDAYKVKDENRRQLVSAKLANARKGNLTSIDNEVESYLSEFENSKKQILEALTPEQRKNFEGYKDIYKTVRSSISEFAITGKITPALSAVIKEGVTAGTLREENKLAWIAYNDQRIKVSQKDKTIAELEAKITKMTGKPASESRGGYVKDSAKKTEGDSKNGNKSSIFAELEKSGALGD